MAKKKTSTGAWSTDPREALMAGADFDLDQMDRGGTPGWDDDKRAAKKFGDQRGDLLSELQERFFAEGRAGGGRALLVIVQGLDTAGKGGTIKRIVERVSPRVFRVVALATPAWEMIVAIPVARMPFW